jgi:hypothetical protein
MTYPRWICRVGVLLLSLSLASVQAAPPTEYVAKDVSWYKCSQVGGTTNTSSSGSGADFVHSLACTIDANTIKAGTILRACAHVTVATGSAAPRLTLKLRAGATPLYAPASDFLPQNSLTRNISFCWITMGGAAPSAASATYTSIEGSVTVLYFNEESNSLSQPISLATNGPLAWTFVSRWTSAGTGLNSVLLNSFTVSITN